MVEILSRNGFLLSGFSATDLMMLKVIIATANVIGITLHLYDRVNRRAVIKRLGFI